MLGIGCAAVSIVPDDADQAFAAGAQFARALAGAEAAAFMVALGEQMVLIRDAIMEAGYSAMKARLAVEAFEIGAKTEWHRITSPERSVPTTSRPEGLATFAHLNARTSENSVTSARQ